MRAWQAKYFPDKTACYDTIAQCFEVAYGLMDLGFVAHIDTEAGIEKATCEVCTSNNKPDPRTLLASGSFPHTQTTAGGFDHAERTLIVGLVHTPVRAPGPRKI